MEWMEMPSRGESGRPGGALEEGQIYFAALLGA